MACYHFRIKSDKKPNGMSVSAADHIAYMNRDGKYRNVDHQQELRSGRRDYGNFFTGENPILALPKQLTLLYSSPYGKIVLDEQGVHVSKNASVDTQAIALLTAQRIFGDELSVCGSEKFATETLSTVRDMELGIHFRDIRMEQQLEHLKEERKEIEWQRGLAEGSAIASRRRTAGRGDGRAVKRGDDESVRNDQYINRYTREFSYTDEQQQQQFRDARVAQELLESDASLPTIRELAKKGLRLHVLPGSDVAHQGRRTSLLLPDHVKREFYDGGGRRDARLILRWAFSRTRRREIEKSADAILGVLQKGVGSEFASSHVQYINREAAFEMRGGVQATGSHLPQWADGSSLRFFHAADRFERANGERYKEIVFSLPNELTLEQQKEILDTFLERHMQNHYYAWAIHDKIGSMSDGERHPHVHLMFSPREIDETERRQERAPEVFFKRANKKEPEKGGCPKAAKWNGADRYKHLLMLREDFARIQNEVLAKYHVPAQVDHRCLEAQKYAAMMRGDDVLAEMLDRLPQKSCSPTSIVRDDDVVREQKQLRRFNNARTQRIIKRELTKDIEREEKCSELFSRIKEDHAALSSSLLAELSPRAQEELKKLYDEMDEAEKEAEISAAVVVWGRSALETARLDHLGEEGREAWEAVTSLRKALHEAKDFEASLFLPFGASDEEDLAFTEVQIAMQGRIKKLTKAYKQAAKKLQPHLKKLSSKSVQKNLPYRVQKILFENELSKTRYEKRLNEYAAAVKKARLRLDDLRSELVMQDRRRELADDISLTLADVKRILEHKRSHTDAQLRHKERELKEAQKDVISYARAVQMAENIWSKGAYKELRERTRKLEKEERFLAEDREKLASDEKAYAQKEKPGRFAIFGNVKSSCQEEQQELEKRRRTVEERTARLAEERAELSRRSAKLEAARDTEAAEKKIGQIAVGILTKNRPAVLRVKKLAARIEALQKASATNGERISAVGKAAASGSPAARYKVVMPPSPNRGGGGTVAPSKLEQAQTIANSILHPQYAALIAKSDKDELIGSWNLVSNMEKDEILDDVSRGR